MLAQGQYGQATFASLDTFLKGTASNFTAVPSPTPMAWRSFEGAWYILDSLRLRPNLQLTLGFRSEFTNGWNEATGRASNYLFGANGVIETQPRVGHSVFTVNNAKFLPEPRVGLAWDTFGHNKTVVHAGFGLHNDLQDDLSFRLDQNAPFNTTLTLKNIPVASLSLARGAPLPAGGKIGPAGVQPNLFTPTVLSYMFKIEQQIEANTVLNVGYVGSHGYHEIVSIDANLPFPAICPAAPCPATLAAGTIFYPSGAPLSNPKLANTTSWFSEGNSSYNALEVDVNHRFSHGLQLRGVYTWSKSLDNGATLNSSVASNSPGFVMNPRNIRADWGLSTFDVRHLAAINGTYELPVGRGKHFLSSVSGWRDKLAGGWSVRGSKLSSLASPLRRSLDSIPRMTGIRATQCARRSIPISRAR
ncbi:MAG: hypothetical protein WBC04_11655 [Candidatus Acidiferrales bacterium]